MDQEKKNIFYLSMALVALLSLVLAVDFSMRLGARTFTGITTIDQLMVNLVLEGKSYLLYVRLTLVINLLSISWLHTEKYGKRSHWILSLIAILFIMLFIYGYTGYVFYNILVYPIIFLAMLATVPRTMGSVINGKDDEIIFMDNTSHSGDFTFFYQTDKGKLALLDVRTATFIEGSAKAGKSASLIIPTIVQAVSKQFAGIIYDYEGDLSEPGSALLSRTAYSAVKQYETPVKFAIINFTDLSRTVRCNPISPDYILSYNHAQELATVIMLNINRSWSKHKDFWGENAIAACAATIWFFRRNLPAFCTIPHVTEFLLHDFREVLAILKSDTDVAPYIRPIIAALERDASGQIAGAEASTQFPLSRLRSPEVYYVFNPPAGAEFNLNITNPSNPVLLSVCNAPELQNALAPAIGAIIQVCKNQMNRLGKHKSIFLFDEMPTIYIDKADKIPAEARKKSVCTFFAVQTYDQLVRDYGNDNARVIRNSCGNLFTGITGVDSADMLSRMMGEVKRPEISFTTSNSGKSVTHALREQRILKASTIASQPTGHFSGRILGGKYFSAQFKYKKYPAEEIPPFSMPVDLGDTNLEQQVLKALIEENYQQVKDEVCMIMEGHSHLFDEGYHQ